MNRERIERIHEDGQRLVWTQLLGEALRGLGYDHESKLQTEEQLRGALVARLKEREQAIAALRSVCEGFGDNDWPDNLHLTDIIEKHLANYLHE